jgi:hypothetical protein
MVRPPATRGIAAVCAAFAAFAIAACGGSAATNASTLPKFTEADAAYFDDGVDLVRDPQGVGGLWQAEWERELGERVARAEFVVVAFVHTLRTDVDLDRRTHYRLVAQVERALSGTAPDGDLTLVSREDAPGYVTVQSHHENVLEQKFVVFARRYRDAVGVPVLHWHLAPASEAVLRQVQARLEASSPTFREVRVIERRE